ncbi:MAG: FecR domain-containing protein, partial [Cyanobium sp. ELA507]
MNQRRRCTATRRLLAALLLLTVGWAQAQSAGQVINVSGPLFAVKADGARRVLAVGSSVDPGDTLITEEKTYARVKFTDQGEVTLRPGTQLKVEAYAFTQEAPKQDNVAFSLFKGALRSVTGLIGKRGNQDAYKMQTTTATIGIRGTQFVAELVPDPAGDVALYGSERLLALQAAGSPPLALAGTTLSDAPGGLLPARSEATDPLQLAQAVPEGAKRSAPCKPGEVCDPLRPPGLYVQVIDGLIQLSNRGGIQQFAAGQFGFTASLLQPPVIVPTNPGIRFNPPPAFSSSSSSSGA